MGWQTLSRAEAEEPRISELGLLHVNAFMFSYTENRISYRIEGFLCDCLNLESYKYQRINVKIQMSRLADLEPSVL